MKLNLKLMNMAISITNYFDVLVSKKIKTTDHYFKQIEHTYKILIRKENDKRRK